MPQLLWDASALAKRYYDEAGREPVDRLFSAADTVMLTTYMSYAETAAILRRKLNSGLLDPLAFRQARLALENEVLLSLSFGLLTLDDAAILAAFQRYAHAQPPAAPVCLLIAADRRLLRAATAEGVQTLNPEVFPVADIPALLARL